MTSISKSENEGKPHWSDQFDCPLTPIESAIVGLSLLQFAIAEGDPKAELDLRVRDIISELQDAMPETSQ